MNKWKGKMMIVMMLGLVMGMAACGGNQASKDGKDAKGSGSYSLLTGGTGGTYYPLGGQFAKLWEEATGDKFTTQTTGASAENMATLQKGEAEVAFSQTDIATYAIEGKEMFKDKIDGIKAIAALYPETVQVVTTEKSGINSIEDLKGKTVSVGAAGSGVNINAKQILEVYGLSFEDIKPQNLSFEESTDGIQSGAIDAAFITAGTPTGAVEGLSAQNDIKILNIEKDKQKKLMDQYPFYASDTIKSGTYGIKEDVSTVAVKAMLVASDKLDEKTVYKMTKALFEAGKINHAKGKFIKAKTALEGLGSIDIHPGAAKYYKEKGIEKS
ncbi:TAXI family TRAP transporter solute-binding subunit [Bacillus changyiensis]|uniref:TAXI family TRAP transporter solute-binding subunit n=1 Tax=Bacillus changyiensis TaxID=3004103 RepID=UPI0022E335CE|nr:TAXI family TRAP transporter solute-binding subunit [Bacillus changyiensis]MDA1474942.1 TAXI family TRAP transporter solute-binding subunit [Bacillus changyiensis]